MGLAAGGFFRHRETAVLVFVATTLPQFFLVGVSWPREMILPLLDAVRRIFPSESAIDGLVHINQMGATLSEVRVDWLYLWVLAVIYFILALLAAPSRFDRGRQCLLELAATSTPSRCWELSRARPAYCYF